jgi:hypothetical protein
MADRLTKAGHARAIRQHVAVVVQRDELAELKLISVWRCQNTFLNIRLHGGAKLEQLQPGNGRCLRSGVSGASMKHAETLLDAI